MDFYDNFFLLGMWLCLEKKKRKKECMYMFDSISVQSMNSFPYFIPRGRGLEVGHDKNSFRIQFNLNPAPTPVNAHDCFCG